MARGWRTTRSRRRYGVHNRLVSSTAARNRARSASINPRPASICSERARDRRTIDTVQRAATIPSSTIATAAATSSQTPIVVSTGLLLHVLVFDCSHGSDCNDLVVRRDAHHDHALRLGPDLRDGPHLG